MNGHRGSLPIQWLAIALRTIEVTGLGKDCHLPDQAQNLAVKYVAIVGCLLLLFLKLSTSIEEVH